LKFLFLGLGNETPIDSSDHRCMAKSASELAVSRFEKNSNVKKIVFFFSYLDPIFSSEDINQQMPEEGRLFSTVDRNYKDIMRHLDKDQHV